MIRIEWRVAVAAIAVFVVLAGVSTVIDGLVFDEAGVTRFGFGAILIGAVSFVVLLSSIQRDNS